MPTRRRARRPSPRSPKPHRPARAARPTMRSVASVNTRREAEREDHLDATSTASPESAADLGEHDEPAAAITRPAPPRPAGCTRSPATGASIEADDEGRRRTGASTAPARSGHMPSTSCRYWAVKKPIPNMAKIAERVDGQRPLNARSGTARRSISGSASVAAGARTRPPATPATTRPRRHHAEAVSAISLIP